MSRIGGSRRGVAITAAIWLAGSAVVVAAQPGTARKEAALGTAAAAIALMVVTWWFTEDADRRYIRTVAAGIIAVSLTSTYLLRQLTNATSGFLIAGLETRIALPLLFVLFLPLVAWALPPELRRPSSAWRQRRRARPLDWIAAAYIVLIVPGVVLGIAHHATKTNIAQDVGLVVFFVFMYVAGRVAIAQWARASSLELVNILLALAVVQLLLTFWVPSPLYTYMEAACGAAIAAALIRPGRGSVLALCVSVVILVNDGIAVHNGSNSTTAILIAGALAVIVYVAVRLRPVVPRLLIVAVAVAGLVVFVGFTSDGRTLRGQYYGPDVSNLGRTFEAQRVRAEIRQSPVSVVLGRGFGATIDERHAPKYFLSSLVSAGRDLAHVQEIHLLDYSFLLKLGFVGVAWLAAFLVALAVVVVQGLERAARFRDETPLIYAALPLLGIAVSFAAATHLQVNPLNGFGLGVLVTYLAAQPVARRQ